MARLIATHISRSQAAKSRTRRSVGKRQKRKAETPVIHPLLQMQQTYGNQAVGRFIQAQLKVSQPGDQYEQEADRVVDHVMRMPDPATVADASKQSMQHPLAIQRVCTECEDNMQRQPMEEEKQPEEQMQKQAKPGHNPTVHPNFHNQITNLQNGGRPLPQAERAFFEPRFGHDFSQVRVHTDGQAAHMANSINAKAFTVGRNIAFGSSEYQPETTIGRKLLAHELTHVIQQRTQPMAKFEKILQPYRPSTDPNFGACNGNGLHEQSFSSGLPYIKQITVRFTGAKNDDEGDRVPVGQLTATYHSNSQSPIVCNVVGGKASEGLSDEGSSFKVKTIEGCGYSQGKAGVPRQMQLQGHERYYQPQYARSRANRGHLLANMNFALIYNGLQAVHYGPMDHGSLSCVHVPSWNQMRQLNYHSMWDTKVEISYDTIVKKDVCCAASKTRTMPHNPCSGITAKDCGSTPGRRRACVPIETPPILASARNSMPDSIENISMMIPVQRGRQHFEAVSFSYSNLVGLMRNDGINYGTWDRRSRVERLQQKLVENGAMLKVDGMFGNETADMLHRFQSRLGFVEQDVVDQATANALEEPGPQPGQPVSISQLEGLKRDDGITYGTWELRPRVGKLQERLSGSGFFCKIDGMFGNETAEALHGFQLSHGFPVADIVDQTTADALEGRDGDIQLQCPEGTVPIPFDDLEIG